MSEFLIEYTAAQSLGRAHAEDRAALERRAEEAVQLLDAGFATDDLNALMAAAVEESGQVSLALSRMSVEVLASVDMYRGVDEDAAGAFRRLAEGI